MDSKLLFDSCQVDHLDEYGPDHGRTDTDTDTDNAGDHNRTKHRRHYSAKRHANGQVIYYRRDGTPMLPVGRRLPPGPDDLPDETQIERLTQLARQRVAALLPVG